MADQARVDLIGASNPMKKVRSLIEKIGPSDSTVLIEGETGTGKEVVAHAIHRESHRKDGPFMVLDCGAVPKSLIESELFGHERGAFTGSVRTRQGIFEIANGGTVFLDELGELPIGLQPKLLRVLEQREVKRVGGSEAIEVDVRVVAATHRDLEGEVKAGRFREDLFYRLAVARVRLPPLRDRMNDVPLLVAHFLATGEFNRNSDGKKKVLHVTPEAMEQLLAHRWPGNARELRNVLEGAVIRAEADRVQIADLPELGRTIAVDPTGIESWLRARGGPEARKADARETATQFAVAAAFAERKESKKEKLEVLVSLFRFQHGDALASALARSPAVSGRLASDLVARCCDAGWPIELPQPLRELWKLPEDKAALALEEFLSRLPRISAVYDRARASADTGPQVEPAQAPAADPETNPPPIRPALGPGPAEIGRATPSPSALADASRRIASWRDRLNGLFDGYARILSVPAEPLELQQVDEPLPTSPRVQEAAQRWREASLTKPGSVNDPHAVLHGNPTWIDPVTLFYRATDYAVIRVSDDLGERVPGILSACGVFICAEDREVLLHFRDPRSRTYPLRMHTIGGAFQPEWPGRGPGDETLLITLWRECVEESRISYADVDVPFVMAEETKTGFVQYVALGVELDRLRKFTRKFEGTTRRVSFDDLPAEVLQNADWVPSGKLHLLLWLAAGAPGAPRASFGKYENADSLLDEVLRRFGPGDAETLPFDRTDGRGGAQP